MASPPPHPSLTTSAKPFTPWKGRISPLAGIEKWTCSGGGALFGLPHPILLFLCFSKSVAGGHISSPQDYTRVQWVLAVLSVFISSKRACSEVDAFSVHAVSLGECVYLCLSSPIGTEDIFVTENSLLLPGGAPSPARGAASRDDSVHGTSCKWLRTARALWGPAAFAEHLGVTMFLLFQHFIPSPRPVFCPVNVSRPPSLLLRAGAGPFTRVSSLVW